METGLTCVPSWEEKRFAEEKPLLEFMGFSFYIDDILILCLLYFLYREEVQDSLLYCILALLLLT